MQDNSKFKRGDSVYHKAGDHQGTITAFHDQLVEVRFSPLEDPKLYYPHELETAGERRERLGPSVILPKSETLDNW